jgi:hypothetical protein
MDKRLKKALEEIPGIVEDLSAEIVFPEIVHFETESRQTNICDGYSCGSRTIYEDYDVAVIDKPRTTKPDLRKRFLANQKLNHILPNLYTIYSNLEWYQIFTRRKIKSAFEMLGF